MKEKQNDIQKTDKKEPEQPFKKTKEPDVEVKTTYTELFDPETGIEMYSEETVITTTTIEP
ncbi:hypothetical protein GF362_01515 [Candidatus Dojkabacteria bacterium]|nr:hypothetical protein [Candidatus Dojkabacteria bacterium]